MPYKDPEAQKAYFKARYQRLKEKLRPAAAAQMRKWRAANPDKVIASTRRHNLKRHYGISEQDYKDLLKAQHGVCAICKTDKPGREGVKHFAVDHDHATGAVRGILCLPCNSGLGHFRDSNAFLASAISYLNAHKSK